MSRARWLLPALMAVASACDNGPTDPVPEYQAALAGAAVIPPVSTAATGSADFTVEANAISYTVTATNVGGITSVTIHTGDATTQGPAVVSLFDQPAGTGAIGSTFAAGSVGESSLNGITLAALVGAFQSSTAYVLVKTLAHPSGEMRGQVQRSIVP